MLELGPLWGEKISRHAYKAGSWYLVEVLFKISNEHPLYVGIPPVLTPLTLTCQVRCLCYTRCSGSLR